MRKILSFFSKLLSTSDEHALSVLRAYYEPTSSARLSYVSVTQKVIKRGVKGE